MKLRFTPPHFEFGRLVVCLPLVLLIIFLFAGCRQEEELPQLEQEEIVEIDAIRQWFEKGEIRSLREDLGNQMRFKVAPNVETLKKEIEWDKYLVHDTKSGRKAYEFSLKYEKSLVPKSVLEGQEEWSGENLYISERVLFFPEGEDDYRIGIFKFYASGNNVNLNEQDFLKQFNVKHQSSELSGLIEEYSWEEAFIKGYRVNDGEITHIRSKISETERELLSRANTYTCSGYLVEYCMMYLTIVTTQDGVSYSFSNGDQECFQSIEVMECAMQQNESPWPEDDPLPGDGPGGGDGPPKSDCTNCCFDPITGLIVECEEGEDDQIINELTDPCADEIFQQTSCSLDFNSIPAGMLNSLNINSGIISMFENATNFKYTIKQENISSGANAITSKQSGGVIVTMNNSYLNTATKLSIARTMIHENLHAYFLYKTATNLDFALALNQFSIDNNTLNLPNTHHELMQQYVLGMALSLYVWDLNYGNNVNSLDFEYYKAMACAGLLDYETNEPNNAFVSIAGDKLQSYLKIISDEATNSTDAKSNPC